MFVLLTAADDYIAQGAFDDKWNDLDAVR